MADKKITQLTPIVGADLVSADEFVVVDVSTDETKSIVLSELIAGIAALPKSGGAMTGAITTNSTFDGRDVATDGTKLDTIATNATADQTFNQILSKTGGTGEYSTTGALTSGRNSGGVSLTINDGYGNANLTFNHKNGVPEQVGNGGRISVNTDGPSAPSMSFQLGSAVTAGVAYVTTQEMKLESTGLNVTNNITLGGTVDGRDVAADGSKLDGIEGGLVWVRKTSNYTSSSNDAVIADTSGGVWTLTLPALPSVGNLVRVVDGADWATNNLTVARNSSTIEGDAADLVMNIGGVSVDFVYDGTTWQLYIQVGANSGTVVTETGTQTLTNKTLTSPTITGTPTVPTATVGTDTTQAASTAFVLANAPASPIKAWVNFNAIGAVAIRDSLNVSSITDNGTGDYTVNFATAMSGVDYLAMGAVVSYSSNFPAALRIKGGVNIAPTLKSTTQVRLISGATNAQGLGDFRECYLAVIN